MIGAHLLQGLPNAHFGQVTPNEIQGWSAFSDDNKLNIHT